jgi:RNA polymerase sigma factor (sigma-70 family)
MDLDLQMSASTPSGFAAEQYFIEGIRKGDKKVLDEIYKKFYPRTQYMVTRNSGTEEDARDLFQEALVAVFDRTNGRPLELTCQFGTFLYSICRNLWLKQLRKRSVHFIDISEAEDNLPNEEELEEVTLWHDRYQLYMRKFAEIGEQCRQLLLRFMQGADMKTIAAEFGFASESYAKKRKFKCKEQLIHKIMEDSGYKYVMDRD